MKKSRTFYSILFFAVILLTHFNFTTSSIVSQNKYVYKSIDGDPLKARIYKLENGLTVYFSINKNEPRIYTQIAVKAGGKTDPGDATGLAHYLEHLMFKGTGKFGTLDFNTEKIYLDKITQLYETYRSTEDTIMRKNIYHVIDSISYVASGYAIPNEYDKITSLLGAKGTNAYTSEESTVYINDIPSNQLAKWIEVEFERFSNPILRLFHTELEVVYEEKNIGLDNDDEKIWDALMTGLFTKHTYGTQTVIGTIEHLKNPSIQKVYDYFNKYYVPNNMAIVMVGDFDMDETIKMLDNTFGTLPKKEDPVFVPPVEDEITSPIFKEVYGPESEYLYIGYRFKGYNDREAEIVTMLSKVLFNGKAGLFDINLNQKQKVLNSGCYFVDYKDYTILLLYAKPREGQTLDELKNILLEQIDLLKKGEFPDWLVSATINNMKLNQLSSYESNNSRAYYLTNSFILDIDWERYINRINRFASVTKEDIVSIANKMLKDNYVYAYKRKGDDKDVKKVVKPQITPVQVNTDVQSDFVKKISSETVNPIQPVFLDFEKDITRSNLKNNVQVFYRENTTNDIFDLYYVFEMGRNNNKKLELATRYLMYLGTSELSSEQIKQEFYKLACSYSVNAGNERIYITLRGLKNNFIPALKLLESLISDCKPDKEALDNYIKDVLKTMADNKLDKGIIFGGLQDYAKYGKFSPFTNILSEAEMKNIKPEELVNIIKDLFSYKHVVLYYGSDKIETVVSGLNQNHKLITDLKAYPEPVKYDELNLNEKQVFVANYKDMVQADLMLISKGNKYNKDIIPIVNLYNEYFGYGMSSIVFQQLREAKALAYSTYSNYATPPSNNESFYNYSYIGTQSDKIQEAIRGFLDLLENMPVIEINLINAKNNIMQRIQTSRIINANILFTFLNAQRYGIQYDIRKDIYEKVQKFSMPDVEQFQKMFVKNHNRTLVVLGDTTKMNMNVFKEYGKVKVLPLEEIFGY
jgi:predicted Zn-dependent peptidase